MKKIEESLLDFEKMCPKNKEDCPTIQLDVYTELENYLSPEEQIAYCKYLEEQQMLSLLMIEMTRISALKRSEL